MTFQANVSTPQTTIFDPSFLILNQIQIDAFFRYPAYHACKAKIFLLTNAPVSSGKETLGLTNVNDTVMT